MCEGGYLCACLLLELPIIMLFAHTLIRAITQRGAGTLREPAPMRSITLKTREMSVRPCVWVEEDTCECVEEDTYVLLCGLSR